MAGTFGREDEDFAQPAYRGGRIEVLARGSIAHAKRWDLHSAYPSVMRDFFSPRACGRVEGGKLRDDAAFAIAEIDVEFAPGFASYPLPVELPGIGLVYPWGSWRARVDLHSLRAIMDAPRGMVTRLAVRRLVQWVPFMDERPFERIGEFFLRRKTDPSASHALKLAMNSSYGLLAEHLSLWQPVDDENDAGDAVRLGNAWWKHVERKGAGTSYVLAAHVTGAIRARAWRETFDAGPIAYMTDGVLCEGEPAAKIGDALGEWAYEGEGRALIVGSGLYATEDAATGRWKTKTRGWSRLPDLAELLRSAGDADTLKIEELRAASIRQLAVTPKAKWGALNELRALPRFLDLNFDRKRLWPRKLRARDFLDGSLTSTAIGFIE